jgi:hypothetical protein
LVLVIGWIGSRYLVLRPSMLDDLGLEPALRWLTQRQAVVAGLQAEVRVDPPGASNSHYGPVSYPTAVLIGAI